MSHHRPIGLSVNDGIDLALCTLIYVCLSRHSDEHSSTAGPGALMAKVDIESAYRFILVHPQDSLLQGVVWDGRAYIDPMLPFGLRSVPEIFNAVADALAWLVQREGVWLCYHYLDDYILEGGCD